MDVILYIILGLLAAFVLFIVFAEFYGYFVHGMPMDFFTPETDAQYARRQERKRNRQRKRERFTSPSTADGKTIFGFPMDDL